MTNGEKIQSMFPNMNFGTLAQDDVIVNRDYSNNDEPQVFISKSVWNAEYKEPTTENDLALIHTWGLDEEIRCTMCTNSIKSDRGCDGGCVVNNAMYKNVMDAIEKRIQPTTKNDGFIEWTRKNSKKLEKDFGELDCISREEVIDYLCKHCPDDGECFKDCDEIKHLRQMPSVTPQEPMVIPIAEVKFDEDKLKELVDKAVFTVTPNIEPRKGYWILTDVEGNRVWHCNCSECGKDPQDYIGGSENWWLIKSKLPKYCPNCGSDNREVKN